MNPTFIIADDHPLFRDAMKLAVSSLSPNCTILTAGDLEELRTILRERDAADLVMLDLTMPGTTGFTSLVSVRAEFPETPVVVVSAKEDPTTIRKCLDLGASGFIPKSSSTEHIMQGVREVLAGEIYVPSHVDLEEDSHSESSDLIRKLQSLTPQQTRVLTMLGEGLLNKQIAYELNVSEATVKAHVSAVLLKLAVDSRTQAVIIMNKLGSELPDTASAAQ